MALNIFPLYLTAVICLSSNREKSPFRRIEEPCMIQTADVAIGSTSNALMPRKHGRASLAQM